MRRLGDVSRRRVVRASRVPTDRPSRPETYVEIRITEAVTSRLNAVNGSPLGMFVSGKPFEPPRRFHNRPAERHASRS